jgi:hypothetical protein
MSPVALPDALSVMRPTVAEPPWPGLAPFTEAMAGQFAGREEEVLALNTLARREPLVLLFGLSGLGKTSLVGAGLVPRLQGSGWFPVRVRLLYTPEAASAEEQLAQALIQATEEQRIECPPRQAGDGLWGWLHRRGTAFWTERHDPVRPLFLIDQFEEAFTLGHTVQLEELGQLLWCIGRACPTHKRQAEFEQDPALQEQFDLTHPGAHTLICLREDFLPDFDSLEHRFPGLGHARLRLRPMTRVQAEKAVLAPGAGLVTGEVAREIVEFVASTPRSLSESVVEPALLSVVCQELNLSRIAQGLDAITTDLLSGHRADILDRFYDRALAGITSEMRAFVEDALLTPSGFRDSRSLDDALERPGVTRAALEELVDRRLLRLEERGGQVRVELTHDRLAGVVQVSRRNRRQKEAIAKAHHEREVLRAGARKRTLGLIVLSILAIGAVVAAIYGLRQRDLAQQREHEAVVARAETDYSRAEAERLAEFLVDDLTAKLSSVGCKSTRCLVFHPRRG